MSKSANQKGIMLAGIIGLVLGLALMIVFNTFWVRSSSNESCVSCHAHPESDASWKQSYHHNNSSGTKTDCAACHLPPKGTFKYARVKAKMGIKDVWSHLFKDSESIDWNSPKARPAV